MARWRDPAPRDWMRPGPSSKRGAARTGGRTGTLESKRSGGRWVRGVRPLRRREGVPTPLETPGFLHRTELHSVRARNRALAWTLVTLVGVATVLAITVQSVLG
ncbi:MAG: hypothetical protein P8188_08495 [Gemmatimonadota bacterium]|jgi:hypothetical protein